MKVKFDLRPAGMVEKERKQGSFNITRLLALLLMALFFGSCIYYIGTMTMEYFTLQEEIIIKEDVVAGLDAENLALGTQIAELQAREKVFTDTLKIMNDDLPTIEVLNALETEADDYGLGFNTLRFSTDATGNVVELTGLAESEELIINFSNRLGASGVFREVSILSVTRNESTGMRSFTLRMPVRPVSEIVRP